MKKFNVVRVEKEMLIYNKLLSMLSFEIMVTYVHVGIDVEVIIVLSKNAISLFCSPPRPSLSLLLSLSPSLYHFLPLKPFSNITSSGLWAST